MTSILRTASDYWHFLFTELGDDRTRGWFFTGSPIPALIVITVYYRFIKIVGPKFMADRKPFNLNKVIQIYNLFQIIVCGWMAYESFVLTFGPSGFYSWATCSPLDKSMSPVAFRKASITWIYYLIKLFDLLDTIFFLLRKKFNQISFLHVYHHIGTVILGYIATKYYPDGHGFLLIPVNSSVHAFMYFYYFMTNYNPQYRKNIWWKKYITQMQIVQFIILIVHFGKTFFMEKCEYPLLPILLFFPQTILMTVLFTNFYINSYIKTDKTLKMP